MYLNSNPKISIITPTFNGGKYLEETILSVLGQNYPNLEYIIIDGGSTDNSVEIIKKYESKLAYWVSEPDKGMYHALQKGFEKSTGELMAWINSDDMYHKNAFMSVAEIFSGIPQVNWLVGASTNYDEYGRTVFCNQSRAFSKLDFLNNDYHWIQQESVFWRRSLWEKVGATLNIKLKYASDFELWSRFIQFGKLYVTHALIGGFRISRNNQLSFEHYDEYIEEVKMAIGVMNVSKEEQSILNKYKNAIKVDKVLKSLKIFRRNWLSERIRTRYFNSNQEIKFYRKDMSFNLSTNKKHETINNHH